MKGFAKLLKDIDNVKRENKASNQEISELLTKIRDYYKNKPELNQRQRLINEAKRKIEVALAYIKALEVGKDRVLTDKARAVIIDVDDYLDEIEKYS